tara:strand:+ start:4975 stop:6303 length:1329 start_codon:yes stop_codon:yes gene_type:complete
MSQNGFQGQGEHHPLLDLLKQLYSSREIVVGAYERSGIDLDDQSLARVEPLIKAHLLRREGYAGLRLNQKLQKVFDGALRKNRIAAINTDLNSELLAAELAMRQLHDVKVSSRVEDLATARDEVEQHLLAMYDILDDSSTAIYNRVTSSYGMQRNPEIRSRENEMYNRQLTQLVESYHQMRNGLYEEPFTLDQDIMAFIGNLDIRCMEVIDRITRTQNTIRDNLFRVRELEHRARKIRAVADYLRQNPGFEALNTRDALDQHPYFRAITPIPVLATPNLSDIGVEEACVELVGKLSESLKYQRPKVERGDSSLRSAEQFERQTTLAALDRMVLKLLAACHSAGAPVSALSFWNQEEKPQDISDLDPSEWLYGLALYMDSDPAAPTGGKTSDYAKVYIHARARHALSGTHDLVDVYLYPAHMSEKEVASFIAKHESRDTVSEA